MVDYVPYLNHIKWPGVMSELELSWEYFLAEGWQEACAQLILFN